VLSKDSDNGEVDDEGNTEGERRLQRVIEVGLQATGSGENEDELYM
jgi:hypothetical protein